MGGNSHDGPAAVATQDVIRHPHWHGLPCRRVDCKAACVNATLALGQLRSLQVRLAGGGLHVGCDLLRPPWSGECRHQWVLRGHNHVGRPKQGVRAGGVHFQLGALLQRAPLRTPQLEGDARSLGAANPGALQGLDARVPVQQAQVPQQPVRVPGDCQHPLPQRHADHGVIAPLRTPVDDFFVGKHSAQSGAPVHGHLCLIRQPPLEQLQEDPLGPLVVVRVGGGDLPVPIV
mmetsp:Transcript_21063/g.63391  ORF Transcript_21063/g.63391 Transcript_21063/m.63391 type:complete len:232 (-) Transcript_21063:921-1616(-)